MDAHAPTLSSPRPPSYLGPPGPGPPGPLCFLFFVFSSRPLPLNPRAAHFPRDQKRSALVHTDDLTSPSLDQH